MTSCDCSSLLKSVTCFGTDPPDMVASNTTMDSTGTYIKQAIHEHIWSIWSAGIRSVNDWYMLLISIHFTLHIVLLGLHPAATAAPTSGDQWNYSVIGIINMTSQILLAPPIDAFRRCLLRGSDSSARPKSSLDGDVVKPICGCVMLPFCVTWRQSSNRIHHFLIFRLYNKMALLIIQLGCLVSAFWHIRRATSFFKGILVRFEVIELPEFGWV